MRRFLVPVFAFLLWSVTACDLGDEPPSQDVPDAESGVEVVSVADIGESDADPEPGDVNGLPPAFHPLDLGGLALYFDADHDASLLRASDGRVSMWRDLSGRENHAYQAVDRLMPVYRSGVQGGRAALDFDRSYLTTSDVLQLRATGDGYTVFAVASNRVADGAGGDEGRGGVLLGNFRRPHSSFAVELHHDRRLRHWWDRRQEFGDPADENRGDAIFEEPRPEQGAFAILTFFLDASEERAGAAVNGEFAEPLPEDGFVYDVERPLRLGADYREQPLPTSWKGEVGEILVYERLLSPSEMSEVQEFLSEKWGIPL